MSRWGRRPDDEDSWGRDDECENPDAAGAMASMQRNRAMYTRGSRSGVVRSVYLLRHPWEPWMKIGSAGNVRGRMVAFKLAWGRQVFPPVVITGPSLMLFRANAYDMEKFLHRRFNSLRVLGEWFKLDRDLRATERVASLLHHKQRGNFIPAVLDFCALTGWPLNHLAFDPANPKRGKNLSHLPIDFWGA